MNEEFTKILFKSFPRLFRNPHETSLKYGFQCGDGWFDLIYKLAQDIESIARESGLHPDSADWPLCRQVKEKMGSLRFVVFGVDTQQSIYERISELRLDALNLSYIYVNNVARLVCRIRLMILLPCVRNTYVFLSLSNLIQLFPSGVST